MSYTQSENYYRNYTPVAYRDEKLAPVPGWGMRAKFLAGGPRVGVGATGFGYDFTIGIPVLGNKTISLPLEKLVADAGVMAVQAAWPPLQQKLEAEMPVLLQKAQDQVVTKLWPALQPKVRAELNYGLTEGKKVAYGVGAVIVTAIFATAYWAKRGR